MQSNTIPDQTTPSDPVNPFSKQLIEGIAVLGQKARDHAQQVQNSGIEEEISELKP